MNTGLEPGSCIAFRPPEHPRASVVVVAWRNAPLLERCLASLASQPADLSFETVVLLNGADADVVDLVRNRVNGARVIESRVNLGFGGGANRAAASTSSEFLVFLNDDTEVAYDWLRPLLDTADSTPDAGVLGSRTLNNHGRLLEAGALVWQNGSVWHIGRGLPAATSRYRYRRRVNYVSGSSMVVRRSAWDSVGGFDEAYFPGYYEDVDLCFSVAALGMTVLYEPRSTVSHHESSSLDVRYKEFVSARNRRRFCAKWERELARLLPEPRNMAAVAPHAEVADALPAVQSSVLVGRGLRRRALLAYSVDHAEERARRGLEALAADGWAVTTVGGDADELGRLGVEVADGDLVEHVAGAPVLYDAVVLPEQGLADGVLSRLRERQRVAVLARPDGGGRAAPADTVRLPADRPEHWPRSLDAALRRTAGLQANGP